MIIVDRGFLKLYTLVFILFSSCITSTQKIGEENTPFILHPVEKLKHDDVALRTTSVVVRLGGNDYESTVLGMDNQFDIPLLINRVSIFQANNSSLSFTFYRLLPYTVTTRTSPFPGRMVSEGDWPDALVPVRLTEETVDPGGSRV
jgi:hypothetical protein